MQYTKLNEGSNLTIILNNITHLVGSKIIAGLGTVSFSSPAPMLYKM